MRRKWVIIGIIVFGLAGTGYGIRGVMRRLRLMSNQAKFAEVRRGDILVRILETGTIEPVEQVVVKSKVAGRILDLRVDEGDIVRAGDLIARIDPVEIERQKRQVEADLAAARAKANWEEAKRTLERKRGLLSRGFASQQDVDLAETQCALAAEEYKAAQQNLDLIKEGARVEEIAAMQAQVERARALLAGAQARQRQNLVNQKEVDAARAQLARLQAQLANIETQLSDTTIVAPISGTGIHRAIEKGELITSGISAFTPGQEIVTIADLSRLVVKVKVNEVDVAHLRLGQKADIRIDALPHETFIGTITKIAPASARQQANLPQTSASEIVWFEVEITLFNPDKRLKTGMSANVDIIGKEARNVLCLPREAVVEKEGQFFAYRVKDRTQWKALRERIRVLENDEDEEAKKKLPPLEQIPVTEKIPITVGLKNENRIEIKSGLNEGDVVLIKEPPIKRRTFQMDQREGGGD